MSDTLSHEAYAALNGRLAYLLDTIDRLQEWSSSGADYQLVATWKVEATAIIQALVGENPAIWESIRWLRNRWSTSDLPLLDEDGLPQVRLSGNESWVFADLVVGDDYGAVDFLARHAIWRNTAALYKIGLDGAVEDDPIYDPKGVFNR